MATPAYQVTSLIKKQDKYSVFVAENNATKKRCYKLRFDVFAKELGANLVIDTNAIDKDRFDDYCQHLVVVDNSTSEIVATTRLLNNAGRKQVGMFYSETEFNLNNIISPAVRFIEVGRTCIHPAYRRGAVLAMLWKGIAEEVVKQDIDYLIGCASIPLNCGDRYIASVMNTIHQHHYAPESLRVHPYIPLKIIQDIPLADNTIMPILLKAYLRQGALICGQPYWDAEFGVADVFVLLESRRITSRYTKHFINRTQK